MQSELIILTRADMRAVIESELAKYPRAGFLDLYKLIYQACTGPSHMAANESEIARQILDESAHIDSRAEALFQDIGCEKGFLRINLKATGFLTVANDRGKQKTISKAYSLARFISASRIRNSNWPEQWLSMWVEIKPILMEYRPVPVSSADLIHRTVAEGRLISHTDVYRKLYSPHYRIIHIHFKEELLTLLDKGATNV